jgi:putative hydrolase of the HAD superfamily
MDRAEHRIARIRLVGLDAAGTLIRVAEPVGDTYARLARAHGVAVPPWRLEDAFRRVLASAPSMLFPEAAPDALAARERDWWRERVRAVFRAADQMVHFADFEAFFDALFAHYARPEAWCPVPGAADALRALRPARRVAVLSNFDHRLEAILAGLGLDALDAVLRPSDLGTAKPDPRFFTRAAARLGAAPHEAVYVGDDPEQDLAPARRAGWRAIDATSLATLGELPGRIGALEQPPPATGTDPDPQDPSRGEEPSG